MIASARETDIGPAFKPCAVASLALAATLLAAACDRRPAVPDLSDPARVTAGRTVYDRHCASCHGAGLEGQPNWTQRQPSGRLPAPPHDDSGHTWHHPSELLFAITKHGLVPPHAPAGYASDMPAFGKLLADDDIWNVLAYIRSRWSAQVRERHTALDAAAARQRREK
jgi:mono/diheme cytochrome c family protein